MESVDNFGIYSVQKKLRKSEQSIYLRLRSIERDAKFVQAFAKRYYIFLLRSFIFMNWSAEDAAYYLSCVLPTLPYTSPFHSDLSLIPCMTQLTSHRY